MTSTDKKPSKNKAAPTLIIGAGLAGLSCAVRLHEVGRSIRVLEASDGIGGRVRTDVVDGFLLDRGFQVYLDAYPEAGNFLDLDALDLRPFEPGALVWKGDRLRTVMDVFRRPASVFSSALAPIGSVVDKLLVAKLRFKLLRKPIEEIWASPEKTTADYLRDFGFSARMIDEFFRSFYGGIFLENELKTSSRIFEFTFKMFSTGSATLPAGGMQKIPEQLAARLPADIIKLHSPVDGVEGNQVISGSQKISAENIVVATDGEATQRLVPEIAAPAWNSTVCLYYAAEKSPIDQPIIALKGDRNGLVNNVCVPSEISHDYAPAGQSLISISVLGDREANAELESEVRRELGDWFGGDVADWRLLRMEKIRKALPVDSPGHSAPPQDIENIFVCGDFTMSGSIEGAILSGLKVADRILERT